MNKIKKFFKSVKGVTLIEALIVITIAGVTLVIWNTTSTGQVKQAISAEGKMFVEKVIAAEKVYRVHERNFLSVPNQDVSGLNSFIDIATKVVKFVETVFTGKSSENGTSSVTTNFTSKDGVEISEELGLNTYSNKYFKRFCVAVVVSNTSLDTSNITSRKTLLGRIAAGLGSIKEYIDKNSTYLNTSLKDEYIVVTAFGDENTKAKDVTVIGVYNPELNEIVYEENNL